MGKEANNNPDTQTDAIDKKTNNNINNLDAQTSGMGWQANNNTKNPNIQVSISKQNELGEYNHKKNGKDINTKAGLNTTNNIIEENQDTTTYIIGELGGMGESDKKADTK